MPPDASPRIHSIENLHAALGLPPLQAPRNSHARRLNLTLDEATFQTWQSRLSARGIDGRLQDADPSALATKDPWQRLEYVRYQITHTEEVIRFADAKAGLLLGVLAAAVGWLAHNFLPVLLRPGSIRTASIQVTWHTQILIALSLLACLAAAWAAAHVVIPRVGLLDRNRYGLFWPQQVARWNRTPDKSIAAHWSNRRSGNVSEDDRTGDFLNLMRYSSPDLILDELSEHAVIQSRICTRKYDCLKLAFRLSAVSVVLVLGLLSLSASQGVYPTETPVDVRNFARSPE